MSQNNRMLGEAKISKLRDTGVPVTAMNAHLSSHGEPL